MFILKVNDQITLRMLSARDAEPLFHLINQSRNHLQVWLPWINDSKTIDDSMQFIKESFEIYNNRQGIVAGVFNDDILVGIIAFNTLNWTDRIGSIGYWLGTGATGKGIMTTSVAALTRYGFMELGLNRIEIRAAEHNYPSRAIPEKLNFTQEGQLRDAEWLGDHFVDHVIYSALNSEWPRSSA